MTIVGPGSSPCAGDYVVAGPAIPTTSGQYELWVDPQAVLECALGAEAAAEATPEELQLALAAAQNATWLLASLTGGEYHGAQRWRDEYALVNRCRVQLRGRPISDVISVIGVEACGDREEVELTGWCRYSEQVIDLCGDSCGQGMIEPTSPYYQGDGYTDFPRWRAVCGCQEPHVLVDYVVASTLPQAALSAASKMACEVMKSFVNKPCSLPERITTVTRQGVSWTVMDPQDFLANGLTGVGTVDAFISGARRARPRAWITEPLYGRLVHREQVGPVQTYC